MRRALAAMIGARICIQERSKCGVSRNILLKAAAAALERSACLHSCGEHDGVDGEAGSMRENRAVFQQEAIGEMLGLRGVFQAGSSSTWLGPVDGAADCVGALTHQIRDARMAMHEPQLPCARGWRTQPGSITAALALIDTDVTMRFLRP